MFNADDVIYTSDPQLFLKKIKKIQKHTSYSKHWAEKDKFSNAELFPEAHNLMLQWLEQKVIPLMNKEMIIADMPCANGEFSFYFSKYVKSIDGFDLSEKMINLAIHTAEQQGITNINFKQADAQTLVFNKKYDVFMLLWLLMYIYDETKVNSILKNIYDSLPVGGYLVVKDSLSENTDKDIYKLDFSVYLYSIFRTIPNFLSLFSKNNFLLIDKIIVDRKDKSGYPNGCVMCALFKKE
jgi:ubiquinone/menaquinone biosynthesis C-methylase UbiE